jgi:Co/Zn/Cd efflux system component
MVRVFIAPILVYGAFLGLSEAAHVLMEGTLAHVDVGSSRDDIEAIDHVDSVHEIHA